MTKKLSQTKKDLKQNKNIKLEKVSINLKLRKLHKVFCEDFLCIGYLSIKQCMIFVSVLMLNRLVMFIKCFFQFFLLSQNHKKSKEGLGGLSFKFMEDFQGCGRHGGRKTNTRPFNPVTNLRGFYENGLVVLNMKIHRCIVLYS